MEQSNGLGRQPWTTVDTKMVEKLILDHPDTSLTQLGKDVFREELFPDRSEVSVRQKVFKVGAKVRSAVAPPCDSLDVRTSTADRRTEFTSSSTPSSLGQLVAEVAPAQPDEVSEAMQRLTDAIQKRRSKEYAQRLRDVVTLIKEPDTKQALALLNSVIQDMETLGGTHGGRQGG